MTLVSTIKICVTRIFVEVSNHITILVLFQLKNNYIIHAKCSPITNLNMSLISTTQTKQHHLGSCHPLALMNTTTITTKVIH